MSRGEFSTMYSHPQRPRPGRRRSQWALWPISRITVLVFAITLLTPTLARDLEVPYREYNSPLFRRLAGRGEIAVDPRDPPPRPHIRQRQDNADPFGSTAAPLPTTISGAASPASSSSKDVNTKTSTQITQVVTPTRAATDNASTTAASNATGSLATATPSADASAPLPSPFDTSLGNNFTVSGCPDFFNAFLNNATFKDCHPTSLLLRNSRSFFEASRSPSLLAIALDASCGAPLVKCSPLMASLASQLTQDSNCGQDYRNENPVVRQAYAGLVAYEPLYRATCLKSDVTGGYCFADAITNVSNPADPYPFYTALGIELPGASRPTCNKCLQDAMNVFAGYAANKDQPVSANYVATAQQIDLGCGPDFANATVPVATISNGADTAKQGARAETPALVAFVVSLVAAFLAF